MIIKKIHCSPPTCWEKLGDIKMGFVHPSVSSTISAQ